VARNESDLEISNDVTEAEGAVIALLARSDPLTRYQILRFFQNSPVRFQNVSKGSVYPLVSRLLDRRMIAEATGSGPHAATVYSLTDSGRAALRRWTQRLASDQMLPLDPLKLRVLALIELSPAERVAWIAKAKQLLLDKKAELHAHRERLTQYRYGDIVFLADDESLDAKLMWLDRLLIKFARELTPDS